MFIPNNLAKMVKRKNRNEEDVASTSKKIYTEEENEPKASPTKSKKKSKKNNNETELNSSCGSPEKTLAKKSEAEEPPQVNPGKTFRIIILF